MITTKIRTYRRKDGPPLVSGKVTTDKAGIEYERSVLMPRERAKRFAAALPGVCLAEAVRDHHATGKQANHYVRWVRAASPLSKMVQALSDLRAQRAADQCDEMTFLPLGASADTFLCIHQYPQPGPDGDEFGMYETSATECTCPDCEFRCRRMGILCKHSLALVIIYPALSPRPVPAKKVMTATERRAWVQQNIERDFA